MAENNTEWVGLECMIICGFCQKEGIENCKHELQKELSFEYDVSTRKKL